LSIVNNLADATVHTYSIVLCSGLGCHNALQVYM